MTSKDDGSVELPLGSKLGFARKIPRINNRPLFALILCAMSLSLFNAILSPTFRGPDEPQHADLVLRLRAGDGFAPPVNHPLSLQIIDALPFNDFQERSRNLEKSAAIPRPSRVTFDEIAERSLESMGINQITQHPPLYTIYVAGFSEVIDRLMPGSWSYDQEIFVMRLANIPLIGLLILLCYRTAISARLKRQQALLAASIPFLIPQLLWLGGVVNNDNLLMVAMAGVTLMGTRVANGDLSRRTAVLMGLWFGAALLIKPLAIAAFPMVVVAYVVARKKDRKLAAKRLATSLTVAFVVGGWWYLKNYLRYQSFLPKTQMLPTKPGFKGDIGLFTTRFIERVNESFFGNFGWLDLKNPTSYAGAMLLVFIGLTISSLFSPDIRLRLTHYLMVVTLIAISYMFALTSYLRTGKLAGLQGRYLFGAIAGLTLLLTIGATNLVRHHAKIKLMILGVIIVGSLIEAYSILRMMRAWYGPPSTPIQSRFDSLIDWSPIPVFFIISTILVVAISFIAAFIFVAREENESSTQLNV